MRFLCTALFVLLFSTAALAAGKPLPDVNTIETYLNGITSLQSRFTQTANDGKQSSGDFYLKRPGRMRFTYDPPSTDKIVADGAFIYYYDGQMKQQRSTPISRSLADFFLRRDLKLTGDLTLSDMKRDGGLLNVTLVQTNAPLAGSLTLMFQEKPLELKKWRVIDAQGLVTVVELANVQLGVDLDNELFHYQDPEHEKYFTNR